MQFREVYKGFEVTVADNILVIKDIETGEEGKLNVEKKDNEAISKMAHFIIEKRINEKQRENPIPTKEVRFSLELRSGERYSHSYLVPENIIEAGKDKLEEYLILKALGDKVSVEIEEVCNNDE